MARLIIGHTTHNSVLIWVRGEQRCPVAFVAIRAGNSTQEKSVLLEERHGYTSVVEFNGLKSNTMYACEVQFARTQDQSAVHRVDFGHCRGRFTTYVTPRSISEFSFLLGSCNLHSLGIVASPDRAFGCMA